MYRVALPKCVLNFCVVNITREEFHLLNQNCRILNKILHISGNIVSKKMADHILEMSGLGLFRDD